MSSFITALRYSLSHTRYFALIFLCLKYAGTTETTGSGRKKEWWTVKKKRPNNQVFNSVDNTTRQLCRFSTEICIYICVWLLEVQLFMNKHLYLHKQGNNYAGSQLEFVFTFVYDYSKFDRLFAFNVSSLYVFT